MTKQVNDTVEVKIIKTEEIRIQAKVKQFAKYAEIPEEQYIDKVIEVCARGFCRGRFQQSKPSSRTVEIRHVQFLTTSCQHLREHAEARADG